MAVQIIFPESRFDEMRRALLPEGDAREFAAFLLAGVSRGPWGTKLLVRDVMPVPVDQYLVQAELQLSIKPEFVAAMLSRADREGLALIQAHSHPFEEGAVAYSLADDRGEGALFPRMAARDPNQVLASLVLGRYTLAARLWTPAGWEPVSRVTVVGKTMVEHSPTNAPTAALAAVPETHHRQALAFGAAGHAVLAKTVVAVVGLGGTGSMVFQQLAHLGIGKVIAIDDDAVAESNLSRIVGATPDDAEQGRYKVEVAARYAAATSPVVDVVAFPGSILDADVAALLREADVVFGCTDTVASRMVLNRFSAQFLIPCIDLGIQIQADAEGTIRSAGGKVHVLLPDAPCLRCLGQLDPARIDAELKTGPERERAIEHGYISGVHVPQPAVIAFNGVVASLALCEFLQLCLGFREPSPWGQERLAFQLMTNEVNRIAYDPALKDECYLCNGLLARGDAEKLQQLRPRP